MKQVKVGIIGGGLMGREAASAFARWFVLKDIPVQPVLSAVCDLNPEVLTWYKQLPTVTLLTTQYQELLESDVEVVYVAVPHHLHTAIYTDVLEAGKDLLAEKPFGIDIDAASAIIEKIAETGRFVRCSSEFPFLPGAQRVVQKVQEGKMGKLLQIRAGFLHASDLDPTKPINWKRQQAYCGKIGVMGDLGMHTLHIPLRLGWMPHWVFAQLQNIYNTRPDGKGGIAECDTWDNATIHGTVLIEGEEVPMMLETKRMAPTETNTWYIEVLGTDGGIRYSTKEPKTCWEYLRGKEQVWQKTDLGFVSVFPTITGGIFEPGFPDCFMQMLAAYFAERAGHLGNRFGCATPAEALASHRIFLAALLSHQGKQVVNLDSMGHVV
jgi:predicted dehydrogenase